MTTPVPEPRELPSPLTFNKDFRGVVDRDFGIRSLPADDVLEPEDVAAPKASASSVTAPAGSQTDLIPEPEDLTVPVEPGPSQLPTETDVVQASTPTTSPGSSEQPATPTTSLPTSPPTISSPSAAKSSAPTKRS